MMKRYQIISGISIIELEDNVNAKEGYEPVGAPFPFGGYWYQAMVLRDPCYIYDTGELIKVR